MKYLSIIFFSISSIALSQDVIHNTNGDSIVSIVSEIGINQIKYHRYDNLDGPLYIIAKNEVSKIDFANGSSEPFVANNEQKGTNIEVTKATILEYINKYAYLRNGVRRYHAAFEDNYLRLIYGKSGKLYKDSYLYDLSGNCTIHELSNRKEGISFINIVITKFRQAKNGKIHRLYKEKLVIMVKGHNNAKVLREALVKYNDFFK